MLSIRKIGIIGRTYRHLNRYRQIVILLVKYGFGDVIEMLKIDQYLEMGLQVITLKKKVKDDRLSRPERVRGLLQELGPTFVKLGQVLSTRPDLVPIDYIIELSKLQDEVPPFSFIEAREIIEAELKNPIGEIFSSIDPVPVASASIGQVHVAVLGESEKVAVKVQRPGIQKVIEVDLEIMFHFATLLERNIEEISFHRPVKIVEEFARVLESELDYFVEASSMERVARQFFREQSIFIPKVYFDYSTSRILTMEFISGIKITDIEKLKGAGLDPRLINRRGADFLMKQVFEYGFFHADLHPGNIFALPGNIICFLDFGMMGTVDRKTRDVFIDLIYGVVTNDPEETCRHLLSLTEYEVRPDSKNFERDIADFMGKHLYKTLKDINIGTLIQDLLRLVSQHRLRIPADIFLMMKAFSTVEGVALRLDPDFDIIRHAKPFIKRARLERYSPKRVINDIYRTASDTIEFLRKIPKELLEITALIRDEKISVKLDINELERLYKSREKSTNNLSVAIIIASLLISSTILTVSMIPPLLKGISLYGLMGYLIALLMLLWLGITILKSK